MTKQTVYLAGPIMGCTAGEANDWRVDVALKLARDDIRAVSPLRCEPLVGKVYSMQHACPKFGTTRAIAAKNMFDILHCEMTLAFIPRLEGTSPYSLGTVAELAWAKMAGKSTILVTSDPYIRDHPVIDACAGWVFDNFDDAIEVIAGVLGGYTIGGKNI